MLFVYIYFMNAKYDCQCVLVFQLNVLQQQLQQQQPPKKKETQKEIKKK